MGKGANTISSGIEIKSPMNICLICVYMPTNNSGDSYLEYMECLDIVNSLLSTYSATHRIIIAGDFNRAYNKHNKLLQAFFSRNEIKTGSIR